MYWILDTVENEENEKFYIVIDRVKLNLLTTNVPIIKKPSEQLTGFYVMGTLVVKRLKW